MTPAVAEALGAALVIRERRWNRRTNLASVAAIAAGLLGIFGAGWMVLLGLVQSGDFPERAPLVSSNAVGVPGMDCVCCGSVAVAERPECTAQGYRRFRCRYCGKQFNERSAGLLNRAQYPSDVIALVVLWRLRYRLTLRDLSEMFLHRGIVFSYEAVREWEAKLAPILAGELRQRRWGKGGARSRRWHVDETYLKVRGRWCYLYRAIDRDGQLVDTMLSEHRDAERAPRHGGGPGLPPLGQVRHWHDP
jgi:transposase-like protein